MTARWTIVLEGATAGVDVAPDRASV